MTNSRGEVKVKLGGVERTMRPTFAANQDIEDQLKLTHFQLLQKVAKYELTIKQIAIIFHGALRGGGEKLTLDEVGEMLCAEGIYSKTTELSNYLLAVTGGGRDPEAKKESPGAGSPQPPAESPSLP
jgi:hypothetical protein